ncbi:hypothetical protein KKC60_04135 [Patescibacteria group bacterium]|nr:hypothetical protein [Patescibacteria group bacterium]
MINLLLVSCGVLLMVYSIVLCQNINTKIGKKELNKERLPILILICLFILGYVAFLSRLIITLNSHGINELLVSAIFFFGAMFVVIVLKVNNKLITKLINNSLRVDKVNKELQRKNKELSHKTDALKISEEKYKARSKELDETLEDFYTIRLGVQEQIEKETIEEENKKVKDRLDEIRSEE